MISGCSEKKKDTESQVSSEVESVSRTSETYTEITSSETDPLVLSSESSSEQTISSEKALEEKAYEILQRMTLEEKAGQMMIASFSGTELTDDIRTCLSDNHFGGVMLGTGNFSDAEQTLRLVSDLQTSNQRGSSIPLLISTDQEGGLITRVHYGTCGVGNMALAATGDPENAKEMASIYAEELRTLGINTDFAPVLDVNNDPNNPVIGVRSFSDDPEVVASFGIAYIEGLSDGNVISTLKHFPGHGDTSTDSHTGFPRIDKTYEELKNFELIPYDAAIGNGAEMIMTAHIQYPLIEKETYMTSSGKEVYLPATLSRTILTDILREDMGFHGVIVTDSLEMAAISENFRFEDVLCMTINAGADMLLLPGVWNDSTFKKTDGAVAMVVEMVKDGRIKEEEINDSVLRILILKEKHGILEESDFAVSDEKISAAKEIVGCAEHREKSHETARQALTLLKNENSAYPLSSRSGKETLILFSGSAESRIGYGKLAKEKLPEENITLMVSTKENEKECLDAASRVENVILVSRVYSRSCLDPKKDAGFSTGVFDRIIKARHDEGKTVIVISCQLPYDGERFPEADAVILSYCSSDLKDVPPEAGAGSAYPPNLEEAILSCFRGDTLYGRAPCDLNP
ncbi:MAG: hypothetical protein J6Y58_04695 [Clostridiales bacterium]|nr:hypothetical protein [Clostridiales bacterium]